MKRRTVVTGTVLTITSAGCLGGRDSRKPDESEPAAETEGETTRRRENDSAGSPQPDSARPSVSEHPRDVVLKNYHDRAHTVGVRMTTGGESLLETEIELAAVGGENVERISDLIADEGRYTITVTLPEHDREASSEWNVTDESSNAVVYITDDGEVEIRPNQSM